jgi:drug/metabolite transporter (DMT)-like permease
MATSSSDHAKGLLLTAIGGLVLTVDIPLIKLAGGDSWSILLLRSGTTFVAAITIWLIWRAFSGNAPALLPGRAGIAVAVFYALSSVTFITAVYTTTTANLVFILAFNTMFAALLSWIFLGERPRIGTLIAMAVMIAGVLIIVADGLAAGNFFGDMMALASAFLIASAITISRSTGKDMGFTPLVAVVLPFALAATIVSQTGFTMEAPWWIILNGAIVMPISFYCLATGPRFLSGPEVAMFYLLETVLAPVWVWILFMETPSTASLIGGTILVVALLSHSIWRLMETRRRPAAKAVRHPV